MQPRVGLVKLDVGRLDQQRNASRPRCSDSVSTSGVVRIESPSAVVATTSTFSPCVQRRARFVQRPGLDQPQGVPGVMGAESRRDRGRESS